MRVNMNKTKVMISGEWQKVMEKAVRWPCGVCGSIIMTRRQQWSVATTLHNVHIPLHSATFVSSWTEFPRRPAVSMSF